MTKSLAGQTLQQISVHGAASQFLSDDQAKSSTGIAPGTVMQIEAVATQNTAGGENGGKLIRFMQPVAVAKLEVRRIRHHPLVTVSDS